MKLRSLIPMLLAAATSFSCAAFSQLNLLSTQQEIEIGRQAAAEIDRELKLFKDPAVVSYVDSLGQLLARHSKRPDLEYSFKVVATEDVNAFALPGGFLYVNLGLIAAAENEAELAGVIGHEVGHVVGRHGARQVSKQFGLAVLIELAVGGENPTLAREIAGQFAAFGAGLTLLKYGRDAEREADMFAVEETYAAGIDPIGIATFFEKLMALHESEPEGSDVWFSTHPPSGERISNVQSQVANLSPKRGLKRDSRRFQEIKARVLSKMPKKTKRKKSEGPDRGRQRR